MTVVLDWRIKPVRLVSHKTRTCEPTEMIFSDAAKSPSDSSEVLPTGSVAVAVIKPLVGRLVGMVAEKVALPVPSVVTLVAPRKVAAWGWLLGAKSALLKNSKR